MQNPVNVDLDTEKLRADANEIRVIAVNAASLLKKAMPTNTGLLGSAFVWAQNVALGFFLGYAVATGQIRPSPLPFPFPIPVPTPVPPGPTPPAPIPTPTPTPEPPKPPAPPRPPAPIPAPGLHVLIVFKAEDAASLPPSQLAIFTDPSLRDYLFAACPKGPDGKTPEYRIWPDAVDASGESKIWQDAYKLPRERTPWIVVSNGTTGYQGPLPDDTAKTKALIQKYEAK